MADNVVNSDLSLGVEDPSGRDEAGGAKGVIMKGSGGRKKGGRTTERKRQKKRERRERVDKPFVEFVDGIAALLLLLLHPCFTP